MSDELSPVFEIVVSNQYINPPNAIKLRRSLRNVLMIALNDGIL